MNKSDVFRGYLKSADLEFLMEAHNGISAKLAEQAGFKALWASGLTISASLGVRDSNELSWTQVIDILEYMNDAVKIPIMVDGDTGHGNFNNVRRFIKKLCDRNIAAVCIEDKIFPKTNSFLDRGQQLANIDEFCGRIKAGKDSQTNDNFSLIARTEALICGMGMDEAVKRAEAYHAAGADAILIHSKKDTADEVMQFAKIWDNRSPLIVVPTKYYTTPTHIFRENKISMVIWANHNLRAAISAMMKLNQKLKKEESLINIESDVATLENIFELVDDNELTIAESRYLPR